MQAIINMESPKTIKEVQKFIGRIAALNRFISRATDKCLPFFKTLKQAFAWTDECEVAFYEFKRYLSNPPLLSPSKEGKNLYLYLAVSATTVSAALIREKNKRQLLVSYISQVRQYLASHKLRQYFQTNMILVMTDQPIKKSTNKLEAAGRMVQWAIELNQFDIEYHPRIAIKAQALADFIAEFTLPDEGNLTNKAELWTVQTDGSLAQQRKEVGVIITNPDGEVLKYRVQLKFSATNNEAEYEGILTGLRLKKALEAKNLLVQNDLKLVIGQIKEECEAKEERMQKYLKLTKHLT